MALTHEDRVCIPVPLHRSFGMVLGALSCTALGAAMVFPSAGFDAAQTLQALVQQKCTALHGEPNHYEALLADPDMANKDFSLMRTGIMAGAPCSAETMQAAVRQLNLKQITVGLGKTETSPLSFQSHVSDPLERRVSSVGRIHPHVQAKVVDPQGRMVPVGTPGELCVRGYLVMRSYWEDAAQTAEAIDQAGWFHTGDLATIDAQGYCSILGRLGGAAAPGSHSNQAT
jgi:fatty-acyl-CoA synthase